MLAVNLVLLPKFFLSKMEWRSLSRRQDWVVELGVKTKTPHLPLLYLEYRSPVQSSPVLAEVEEF